MIEDTLVEDTGPDLSAIRVGHVVEREQHPNADRLSFCRVDLGEDELREIVCGAPNVAAGQKVAVAVVKNLRKKPNEILLLPVVLLE